MFVVECNSLRQIDVGEWPNVDVSYRPLAVNRCTAPTPHRTLQKPAQRASGHDYIPEPLVSIYIDHVLYMQVFQ